MPSAGTAYVPFVGDFTALNRGLATALAPGKLGKMGKVAGAGLVAGFAAAGIGKVLYDVGKEFDAAYDTIQTGTGKTGKSLARLKEDFRGVIGNTPTDFQSAAKAVTFLNQRLDETGQPLQKIARQMLELSRITGTDLQSNMEEATRVIADFGIKGGAKQSAALDRLFRVTQKTGVGFSDLASNMVKFGSPLRQLGFNFDTTAALFAKFQKEGVNIRTALPGLRLALGAFAEAGQDPAKSLQALLEQIRATDTNAEAYRLNIAGLGTVLQIFGKRAGPDLVAAVKEGRFGFEDLVKVMRSGGDTILGTAEQTKDFSEYWLEFKNNLKLIVEPAAVGFFKLIGQGMKRIVEIMRDPNLNFGEKLGKLFSEGAQAAIKGAAALGPKLAGALISGFLNADIWGKLLMGGIAAKLALSLGGGKGGLFTNLGTSAGKKWALAFLAAALSLELGKTIVNAWNGEMLAATKSENLAQAINTQLGDVAKFTSIGRKGVTVGTQFGRLIFNPETGKVIAASTAKLKSLVGKSVAEVNQALTERLGGVTGGKGAGKGIQTPGQAWGQALDALTGIAHNRLGKLIGITKVDLHTMRQAVSQGMNWRDVVAGHFDVMIATVRRKMTRMGELTKAGTDRINQILTAELAVFGASLPKGARRVTNLAPFVPNVPGKQRGGMLAGRPTGDKIPLWAEGGEYIVNAKATRRFLPMLERMNRAVPRFQKGGRLSKLHFAATEPGVLDDISAGALNIEAAAALAFLKRHFGAGNVQSLLREAKRMESLKQPYVWGGGHAGFSRNGPWDCSGAVSQLLHGAGYPINAPMVSGGFMQYGLPGLAQGNTGIWANPSHVWATINGQGFSTSAENPGNGWGSVSYSSRPGFTKRHPDIAHTSRTRGQPLAKGFQRGGVLRHGPGGMGGKVHNPYKWYEGFASWGRKEWGDYFGSGVGSGMSLGTWYEILRDYGSYRGISGNRLIDKWGDVSTTQTNTPEDSLWLWKWAHAMRHRRGGIVKGKTSVFGPPLEGAGTTASGVSSSRPGIAIYDRSTLGKMFRVTIGKHTANLRQIDIGPAPRTGRKIDITGAGARALGINPRNFPTDSMGVARLISESVKGGGGVAGVKGTPAAPAFLPEGGSAIFTPETLRAEKRAEKLAKAQKILAHPEMYSKKAVRWAQMTALALREVPAGEEDTSAADAAQALADAQSQLASEIASLRASVNEQNAIAKSEMAIGLAEAKRAFADMLSGELGGRVTRRGHTAGAGSVVRS